MNEPTFNGMVQAVAHLTRTIDAYAEDYAAHGEDSARRPEIAKAIDKLLSTWLPRPRLTDGRLVQLLNDEQVSDKIIEGTPTHLEDWLDFARAVEALVRGD